MKLLVAVLFISLCLYAGARTAEEWKTRSVYQMLTDRFATSDGSTPVCEDLGNYCGGTWKGIERNLDYIQGMGFDAIWISPLVKNAPGGYHGYWTTNFYELNENFGTKQDWRDLVKACKDRDMWIMVDVVPNHVANVPNNNDFSGIVPFNKAEHYHHPVENCAWYFKNDPMNQEKMETCWLEFLPDLKQEDEFVRKTLIDWVRDFVQEYEIDGLRIDALRHVPTWFWKEYAQSSGVFTIGETFFKDVAYCAQYQKVIDSLLNFPLQYKLNYAFHQGGSMTAIANYFAEASIWSDQTVLGNFVSNHDMNRYLHNNTDVAGFKAIYGFVLTCVGIPLVYYGDEQLFDGGRDPKNRETLWGKMNQESEMYQFFKTLNKFRKDTQFFLEPQVERQVDEYFYSFTRGKYFFAFTNILESVTQTISSHSYTENTVLCNLFDEKECVKVVNGKFQLTIVDKQVKILIPTVTEESKSEGNKVLQGIKNALGAAVSSGDKSNA